MRAFVRTGVSGLSTERLALLLLLAGVHTRAIRDATSDALENPLVLDTVIRGVFDAAALVIVLPLLVRRLQRPFRYRYFGLAALVVYGAVALGSSLYSVSLLSTAGKGFELMTALAIVLAMALQARPRQELHKAIFLVVFLEAALVATAVIGFFVLPGMFSEVQNRTGFLFRATMVAPYTHSNTMSAMSALASVYGLARYFTATSLQERRRWLAMVAFMVAGLALASGRQGIAMWLVPVAVLLLIYRRRLFILLLGPAAVGAAVWAWDSIISTLERGQAAGSLATLTGRTTFWESAIESWLRHPWTGYGFGAGGRYVALDKIGAAEFSHLHNGYLETLMGVGLLGMIPLLMALFRTFPWALSALRYRGDVSSAILLLPLVLRTAVSVGFGGWVKPEFLVFALIVALADTARSRRVLEPHAPPRAVG